MKKILHVFLFLLVTGSAFGQVPMFFNTNTAAGQNAIPMSSGATLTWRRAQWFIPPNSIGAVTVGNQITAVYFQAGSTASVVYPNLTVKLKVGSGTGLTGVAAGPFEPNMITVYNGVNVTISATANNWIQFPLSAPFLYNPNLPLIVEIEHTATSGSGPSLCQAVSIPGPGNGRQWGDISPANIAGVGTQQINFGIDVIPATPCTAAPSANTVVPASFTTCPGLANPLLGFATTYSFGGITYQWQSSTLSPVGPFTTIPGATLNTAPAGTLGVTTWFQAVATCTNPGGGSTTLTPTQFFVAGAVTSNVPYFEDFETIQMNNRFPNCSWWATNLGSSVTTYTNSSTNNRVAASGTKFIAFGSPSSNNHIYTNGIQLQPGITYSANIWYATEYLGASNFTNLSLLVGPNQTATGLTQIASVGPAVSGPYKALGGTFTVPTAGIYYIAIRANATTGGAVYLSMDDLSVTIPCTPASGNSPTVSLNASTNTICAGETVNLTAGGADTYSWNDGSQTSAINVAPANSGLYIVSGTNTLTGCTTTMSQMITVNPSPFVFGIANKPSLCAGESAFITAYGANSYAWNNGGGNAVLPVTPSVTTSYSVVGTALNGCPGNAVVTVSVKPTPTVSATSDVNESCAGDAVNLSGVGASNYQWLMSSSALLLNGNPVTIPLTTTTTFTMVGTAANGCSAKFTITQNVAACVGINENANSLSAVMIYPNPTSGEFVIETASNDLKTIEVIDVTGRVISTVNSADTKLTVNISTANNGIYFVKIKSPDAVKVFELIKK